MRFASVDFFVGLAEWTHAAFHLSDEPEGYAALLAPGTSTNRAFHTALGQGAVTVGNFRFAHKGGEVGLSSPDIRLNGGDVRQAGPPLYRWGISPSMLGSEQGWSLNARRWGGGRSADGGP